VFLLSGARCTYVSTLDYWLANKLVLTAAAAARTVASFYAPFGEITLKSSDRPGQYINTCHLNVSGNA
jgi:hypothetical protein